MNLPPLWPDFRFCRRAAIGMVQGAGSAPRGTAGPRAGGRHLHNLRPLTHLGADGRVYQRRPEVEQQIREAIELSHTELQQRIEITDRVATGYLKDECLVYLLREALRSGAGGDVELLRDAIVRRCLPIVRRWVGTLAEADDAVQDGIEQVFTRIGDRHSDRGDYYEVSFGQAVHTAAIDTYRRHFRREQAAAGGIALDGLEERLAGPATDTPEASVLRKERLMEAGEALSTLREPLREAVVLRHYFGWPLEDSDPRRPCLCRHFNVTARTLNNWFRDAERTLALWRERRGQA
jgi:DNA-directed RNA polymerase specialized sigma24 family protein